MNYFFSQQEIGGIWVLGAVVRTPNTFIGAVSSAGIERSLDVRKVGGSNPPPPIWN